METTTPFDLNQAILEWRHRLAQTPAIRAESLDELEVHLRDSVATLQGRGLSGEEAFLIATRRVGAPAQLSNEYNKVNPQSAWLERVFWGIVMMLFFGMIQSVGAGFINIFNVHRQSAPVWWLELPLAIGVYCLPIALLFMFLIKPSKSRMGGVLDQVSRRPFALAFGLLVLGQISHLLMFWLMNYSNSVHQSGILYSGYLTRSFPSWRVFLQFLPAGLINSFFVFVLARKRLLRLA